MRQAPFGVRPADGEGGPFAVTTRASWTRIAWLPPALLVMVLGLFDLGRPSVWLDEATSIALARARWGDFLSIAADKEANMSFYYLLLRFWTWLGSGEAVVRFLSVGAAVAAIPALFAVSSRLFDRRVAGVASWLLAINAFFVHYAHQARGYSLVVLFVVLSTLFLVRAATQERLVDWIAFAVISAAAVYTHFFAGLVLVAQIAVIPFLRIRFRPRVLVAAGILLLLLAPLGVFFMTQNGSQVAWIPATTLRSVVPTFKSLTGMGGLALLSLYFGGCLLGTLALARSREPGWTRALVLAWVVVPVVGAFGVSLAVPLLRPQYLIVIVPGLAVLAALGLRMLPRLASAAALILITILSLSAMPPMFRALETHDWRDAAHFVRERSEPGDAVVLYVYYGATPFSYYARSSEFPVDRAAYPPMRWSDRAIIRELPLEPYVQGIVSAPRVWLVLNNARTDTPTAELKVLLDRLRADFRPGAYQEFIGGIRVREYVRRG